MKEAGHNSGKISLKETDDGSHTLFSEQFHQHYHNCRGAVTESKHIFFEQNGLEAVLQQRAGINILEVGFGTGLNLMLLADYYLGLKPGTAIRYVGIEAHPVSSHLARKLNFGNYLTHPKVMETLPAIFHRLRKGTNHFNLFPGLEFILFNGFFKDFNPDKANFDYIFHDAFSPSENPELWTKEAFLHLLEWCKPEGILTTYCAASKIRGAMASAGWKVARAAGAPGKREMTLASPTEPPLRGFTRMNETRLARRYEHNDFNG